MNEKGAEKNSFKNELEYTFSVPKIILGWLGLFPSENGNYKKINFYFVLFMVIYCCILTAYATAIEFPNLNKVIIYLTPFTAWIGATCKLTAYIVYHEKVYRLLAKTRNEFRAEFTTAIKEEKEIVKQYAINGLKTNRLQAIFVSLAAVGTFFKCFYYMYASDADVMRRHKGRIMPYEMWTPFKIDVYDDPYFEIAFAVEYVVYFVTVAVLISMDCLLICFTINVCGQYFILNKRIENFECYKQFNTTANSADEFLKQCVVKHQKLNEFCVELENVFTFPLLGEFVAVCIFLCSSSFLILTGISETFILVENLFCVAAGVTQLYFYCYFADKLTEEAGKVAVAAYNSNWINASKSTSKLIQIIMHRSQIPVVLTAGKFAPVTVSTFMQIMRTSMSYLTVLRTINEDY